MASEIELSDSDEVNELLGKLQQKYNLSMAYLRYLLPEVEDIFDQPADRRQPMIQQIEKDIASLEYEVLEEVGKGAFGCVFKAKRKKDSQIVAVKVIDLEESKDDIFAITKEITALANTRLCPQLINYYASTVVGHKLWIVMEFVDGGSILDKIKRKPLTEAQIAVVVREVLLGLDYLAKDQRIHRDIKAANILLTQKGQPKLADFGAAGQLTDTMTKCNTFVGSPYWMAPEILSSNKYDGKADIWSLGITVMEMLTGKPPLANFPPLKVISVIPNSPPPKPPQGISQELHDFIVACLEKDPTKRPSIKGLLKTKFVASAGPIDTLISLAQNK